MTLDTRLSFKAHVQYAAAKAAKVANALARLMSTTKETFSFSGDLDTYIWAIWGEALKIE